MTKIQLKIEKNAFSLQIRPLLESAIEANSKRLASKFVEIVTTCRALNY
jgi:hypothetical protein